LHVKNEEESLIKSTVFIKVDGGSLATRTSEVYKKAQTANLS